VLRVYGDGPWIRTRTAKLEASKAVHYLSPPLVLPAGLESYLCYHGLRDGIRTHILPLTVLDLGDRADTRRYKVNCIACQCLTDNPKFCSHSCAARVNNRLAPKKARKLRTCRRCKQDFLPAAGSTAKTCTACKRPPGPWLHRTIGNVRTAMGNKGKHPSWIHASVRSAARRQHRRVDDSCQRCGYSVHVEIAHIKPISDFADDVPLSVVNAAENILKLCPNCHWEFDQGLWHPREHLVCALYPTAQAAVNTFSC